MAARSLAKRDIPWCLLALVALSTTCHICVLLGNYKTAQVLETIGQSTKGWSGVGLSISHSLQNELDVIMTNMSTGLLDAINHTMHTSEILNTVTSLAGIAADHIASSDAAKAITLLQQHMELVGSPLGVLPGLLTSSVDKLLDKLLKKAVDALDMLMAKLKPVLQEVGKFMIKFGDRIQTVVEGFSITLDHVQKLFDQVMASVSAHGTGEPEMREQTFNLFDVSNTGFVNKQDLKDVATLYDVSALRGTKPDELVDKYDKDGDGRLNKAEFKLFVHDPSLPNAMSVLLRSYAKRLAEVAGNVGSARQRDEVAQRVVNYLQLLCAKNLEKMTWVADALANGELPLEFTADVMAELALAVDDPGVLTKVDVGAMVIGTMIKLHPANTRKAYELMSNTSFWIEEGFHPSEHPICLKRVTLWMTAAAGKHLLLTSMGNSTARQPLELVDTTSLLDSEAVFNSCEENMKAHVDREESVKEEVDAQMFQTKSSRIMLAHLLGGAMPSHSIGSEAARIVKAGMPARPATLVFAQKLAANATKTAKHFQSMCFNYSSKSSNAIDSFATQIQGMVKKIQGFIKMMERYSTPAGINQLESQVHNFAQNAGKDVLKLVKNKFGAVMNRSAPVIEKAVDKAVDSVGNNLGHSIATALATSLGQALEPALESIVKGMMKSNSSSSGKASKHIAKELAELLGKEVSKMSGDELGHELGKLLHKMINSAMSHAGTLLNKTHIKIPGLDLIEEHFADEVPLDHVFTRLNQHAALHLASAARSDDHLSDLENKVSQSLRYTTDVLGRAAEKEISHLNLQSRGVDDLEDADLLSGAWQEVSTVLRSMSNVLPQATKTLKFARLEVSKLAANLDSIFEPFQTVGPHVFNEFSRLYRLVWTLYFCILFPLTCALVLYAFWAGGFLGGPGTGWMEEETEDDRTSEDQKGIRWHLDTCCRACCHCCRGCHDWSLSFWSFIILMQLVVALIFVVALLLLVLGAVKAFVAAGCQQMYILGDETICGQTLQLLRGFLHSFKADWALSELPKACVREELLVCKRISNELQTSAFLTGTFGFLAAVLSFMQLVESSALHARAVWRRKAVRQLNGLETTKTSEEM